MAVKNDLPIVIHCRESFDEIFEILEEENCGNLRGVFHCFTGNIDQANKAIGLGFLLGIGGVVTFKNGGIDKFINQIDLKHIVLETDAPYLLPRTLRPKPKSRRNEPKHLTEVLSVLAACRKEDASWLGLTTSNNARSLFQLDSRALTPAAEVTTS